MRPGNSDKAWKNLGETDPYWAVKGGDDLKKENIDDDAKARFFDSGKAHIEQLLTLVRTNLDSTFKPTSALDFGCGVGRMLIPLSSISDRVVGVDVSEAMLQEAKLKCDENGLSNIEFVLGKDRLSAVKGTFDFIHSNIVFQHIPENRGIAIFERLIDLLNENGIATIHVTYFRNVSHFRKSVNWARRTLPLVNNIVNLIQGNRFGLPYHQMNSYNLNQLFRILREKGCARSFVNNLPSSEGFFRMMLCVQKKQFSDDQ